VESSEAARRATRAWSPLAAAVSSMTTRKERAHAIQKQIREVLLLLPVAKKLCELDVKLGG